MKTRKLHILVVNDIIYSTSTNYNKIVEMFKDIVKTNHNCYIQTIYT
jgi:hypothetical protein